jgi:hypothetical protein
MTPIGAIVRGLAAGTAGTAAMDLAQYLEYRQGGGKTGFLDWETSAGLTDWESAPAPAQVAKRLAEALAGTELKPDMARAANNAVHWATGIGWGGLYGVVAGSRPSPKVRYGLLWGTLVWATGYAILPLAGLYKPIWEYDTRTLAKDLGAHLVYGLTTAATFRAMAP